MPSQGNREPVDHGAGIPLLKSRRRRRRRRRRCAEKRRQETCRDERDLRDLVFECVTTHGVHSVGDPAHLETKLRVGLGIDELGGCVVD